MKFFVVALCFASVAVASHLPADTPEVAAAKAQHFAAHQEALARNWASDAVVNNAWVSAAPAWNAWTARAGSWYAPQWGRWLEPAQISVVNGHVQDTPEVAAEKAKHFALVAEAQARSGVSAYNAVPAYVGAEDDGQYREVDEQVGAIIPAVTRVSASYSSVPVSRVAGYVSAPVVASYAAPAVIARTYQPANIVVANGHVQDTPEVAAEKAKHLSIFAQTAARDAAAGSTEWADNAENWKSWGAPAAISTYAAVAPVVSGVYPSWTARTYQPANVVVANGHVQDTPEVAAEKARHLALVAEAKARDASSGSDEWSDAPAAAVVASYAAPAVVSRYTASAPVVVARTAPIAAAVAGPVHSQFHAQDEAGQYSYGYTGGLSTKNEAKTIDGVTRGAFSYVDANGIVQSRSYVADDFGFRVAASDLPAGPSPVAAVAAPAPAPVAQVYSAPIVQARTILRHAPATVVVNADGTLQDTPEVAAAKAQHFAAHQQELTRQNW